MNDSVLTFTIPGEPVPKGRPRFARRGNFTVAYTPEKTASYENLVKIKAAEAMTGRSMIEGAVSVTVNFHTVPPASWSKKKRLAALAGDVLPTSKPDIDNCLKGIFDAMNSIVWLDDKQACSVTVTKRYAESANTLIHVEAIQSMT